MTKGAKKKVLLLSTILFMFFLFAPKIQAASTYIYVNKNDINAKMKEKYSNEVSLVQYAIDEFEKHDIPYQVSFVHTPGYPVYTYFSISIYQQKDLVMEYFYEYDSYYQLLYRMQRSTTAYDSFSFSIPIQNNTIDQAQIDQYIKQYQDQTLTFKHVDVQDSYFNHYRYAKISSSESTINITGGFLDRNSSSIRRTTILYASSLQHQFNETKSDTRFQFIDESGKPVDNDVVYEPVRGESITFQLGDVHLNDELVIQSYEVKAIFRLFDRSRYRYYYKFSDDDDFTEIKEAENKTFVYEFKKNGTYFVKVVDLTTKEVISKTFSISKIGAVYQENMDFESFYDEDDVLIKDESFDFGLESDDEQEGFLANIFVKVKNVVFGKFPIIHEIGDLIHSYKFNSSNSGCSSLGLQLVYDEEQDSWYKEVYYFDYCNMIPKINLSKIGIDKSFEVLDVRYYLKYKKKIWGYIKLFVGTFTLLKCLSILKGYFRR